MALLETLSSNELFNFIIYDTISATPFNNHDISSSEPTFLVETRVKPQEHDPSSSFNNNNIDHSSRKRQSAEPQVQQGRRKRRRKPRVCKNKEEAETQRMTHITVERNRRKQMNEHLAVLRSLMPESYVQRGDQASIVGGAIEFVKELEHLLQSLEAKKLQILQQSNEDSTILKLMRPPFAQFFVYPQYTWSQAPNKYTSKTQAAIADIEVTLIETHANLRILSRKSPRQLSQLVAGFQALSLTILHLNVTTMDPLVLYSISAKALIFFKLTETNRAICDSHQPFCFLVLAHRNGLDQSFIQAVGRDMPWLVQGRVVIILDFVIWVLIVCGRRLCVPSTVLGNEGVVTHQKKSTDQDANNGYDEGREIRGGIIVILREFEGGRRRRRRVHYVTPLRTIQATKALGTVFVVHVWNPSSWIAK
ncbi:transcription factor bHLH71-like [Senna tora]|uniref:Transcription factor bHLH71-like n=1 Tax=Senna tora TaxID=362788 RepID=A0A834TYY3_9FABA|nr:transcription factor bHLH71-like [Senna tora]